MAVAGFAVWASYAPFWPFLPMFLKKGVGAAGGIAAINTIGSVAGFIAPFLVGYIKEQTGSYNPGLLMVAPVVAVAGLVALAFPARAMPPVPTRLRTASD